MANRINDWQGLITLANDDLKKFGAMLLHHEDEEDGTFSLEILYGLDFDNFDVTKYKECDTFAENMYEDEMSDCVNEAWSHARAKVKAQKVKTYVVFGTTPNNLRFNGEWEGLADYWKDDPSAIGMREFETKAELNAYILGLNDSLGWGDVTALEPSEVEKLGEHMELELVDTPCE